MLSTLFSLAALPLAANALLDFPADNRMLQQPGILRYPITVSSGAPVRSVRRRQNDAGLTNQKTGYFYSIDLGLGTPGQTVSVNFDTGSSELWVNPVCSKSADPAFCEKFGRFTNSSSFVDLNTQGGVKYGTGFVDFEYGYDYASIGSAKISQQIFGVATDSEFATTGIMGAGPDLNGWASPYPFVIDNLATQGFTNSRAFSLDLRSIESKRGSVVFGGIDIKKFSGSLEKRPIIPAADSPDGLTRFWIYLDGISITKEDGKEVTAFDKVNGQPVLVDSGATISALPGSIVDEILKAFPSATQQGSLYHVDCPAADSKETVNFKFGNLVVNAPIFDFVWQQPENNACALGVHKDDEFPVLGDTFLRSAYVVFDWDNRNLHIANNEDCGSELVAIGSGPDAVPSVTGGCGPVTTTSAEPTTTEPATTTSEAVTTTSEEPITTTTSEAPITTTTSEEPITTTHGSNSTAPVTTSGAISTTGWHNTSAPVTTAPATITSTYTTTSVHTITSCPPYVTNCPIGSVTTETLTSLTTFCPGTTKAPKPTSSTSTFTTTSVHTVTKCPGGGPCHEGVTTEVLTKTTLVCPQSTGTFSLPTTYKCSGGRTTCAPHSTNHVITIVPITTKTVVVPVPGCQGCGATVTATQPVATAVTPVETTPVVTVPVEPTPVVTAPAQTVPIGTNPVGISTVVKPVPTTGGPSPPIATGAAAEWRASGLAALAMGALAVVVM